MPLLVLLLQNCSVQSASTAKWGAGSFIPSNGSWRRFGSCCNLTGDASNLRDTARAVLNVAGETVSFVGTHPSIESSINLTKRDKPAGILVSTPNLTVR